MKWTLIKNPTAGSGKSMKLWPKVRDLLIDLGLNVTDFRTNATGHATILTREAIMNGARHFIVMGGDSTVSEVANGILGQSICPSTDILLTQIPVGKSNNWSRTVGIPQKLSSIEELFNHGTEIFQDVGLVSWHNEANKLKQRYFINMVAMGFDAYVSKVAEARKTMGKSMGYLSILFAALRSYKPKDIELKIDNQHRGDFELFSLALGICKYRAAGIKQCPDARYDDGLLDLTLIEKISAFKVIRTISRLYGGSFIKNKAVHQFRGHQFDIKTVKSNFLEVDGEIIGSGSASFSVLPKQLKLLVLKSS